MFWMRNKKENKAKLEHKLYLARETPEPIFDLSECDIRQVPTGIYSLCRVFLKEHLHLSFNQLSSLSGGGSLNDLQNLTTLAINNNAFTHLPEEISMLSNLKELYIQHNHIKKLPLSICSLINLHVLNTSFNELRDLPQNFGNLTNIRNLNICGNVKLKELPRSFCKAQKLTMLEVDSEGFLYPPAHLFTQGTREVLKFLCDDNNMDLQNIDTAEEVDSTHMPANNALSQNDEFEAKIWKLEKIKELRLKEFLAIERNNELMQRQEIEVANTMKLNKEKLLADIIRQQNKLDESLDKIQHVKEVERFKLIEQLQEVEQNADLAIKQLLQLNREPLTLLLEQERMEQEKIIAAANKENDNLCKNDILNAMKDLLEKETIKYQEFDKFRSETSKSILEQELQNDSHLLNILKEQEFINQRLSVQLLEDSELQKVAVGALLEKSDARSWSLVQQVKLVESQLAALTLIEMDRHKLQIDKQLNDLAEKRMGLSVLLMDLLEQQSIRRSQLLSTLQSLEQIQLDKQEDYWLRQYQQILDRMPEGLSDFQHNLNQSLVESLLMAGVLSYLPFLAKWSRNEEQLLNISLEILQEAGIKNMKDCNKILDALHLYKKQKLSYKNIYEKPSAPAMSPTNEATAPIFDPTPTSEASAPAASPTKERSTSLEISFTTSECVICMDHQCEIIHVPCGHFCCCQNCTSSITECPMCRSRIDQKIKVHTV